jgi:hypothetical protein
MEAQTGQAGQQEKDKYSFLGRQRHAEFRVLSFSPVYS